MTVSCPPLARLLASAASLALCLSLPAMTQAAEAPQIHAVPAPASAGGYFAQKSTLPFEAPDFSKFGDADYQPAIEQGMAIQRAEIRAIAENPAPPTFANTLEAMERSGQMLNRAYSAFGAMVAANTNEKLDAIEEELSPRLSAHFDAIYLDPRLFARIKTLWEARGTLEEGSEEARLIDVTYQRFVNAGAELDDADKAALVDLNARLSSLGTQFSQRLTEATKQAALVVEREKDLAGLSQAEVAAAAKEAEARGLAGKYVLTLVNTTQQPMLARLENRETRRRLFEASVTRTSRGDVNDTRQIISEMAELRARKAALLRYPDYASAAMFDRMVKDPEQAIAFMESMVPAVAERQEEEAHELNAAIRADGGKFTVQPWDWDFYSERVRKAKYDLDESAVRPYFEVKRVLEDGVFHAANLVYGLSFKQRSDIPAYHPDVTVYTVFDADGSELGLFYFDPFARPNKQGGAWMGNFVEQSFLMGTRPVIYNVLNIPKPAQGEPALVSFDDMITMFHEFGHGLHGLFAAQKYPSLSGTNTARDFVEFPSQFNENFATLPEVLPHFARHWQSGEPMPAELLDKVRRARNFNQGYAFGEILAATLLDLKWHTIRPGRSANADDFEKWVLPSMGLKTDLVPPRYHSPYFRHIWDHGYAAGYYSYTWTEMIAHDAFARFMEQGGATRANGDLFRAKVLSRGNSMDYEALYKAYAGQMPTADALLKARGLSGEPRP